MDKFINMEAVGLNFSLGAQVKLVASELHQENEQILNIL